MFFFNKQTCQQKRNIDQKQKNVYPPLKHNYVILTNFGKI